MLGMICYVKFFFFFNFTSPTVTHQTGDVQRSPAVVFQGIKKEENTAEAKMRLFLARKLKQGPQVFQRRSFNIIHFYIFGRKFHYYSWINIFHIFFTSHCTFSSRLPLKSVQMQTQPHRLPLEVALATAIPAVAKQLRPWQPWPEQKHIFY